MEGSHSGLVRTLGKRVWRNPPGVRISYPPHIGFLCYNFNMNFKKLYKEASKITSVKKLTKYASCGGVSCALMTKKGNIYTGICIDCCSGIGFCAEHSAIAEMLKSGESEIKEILSVKEGRGNEVIPPCGRCREFMLQINLNNKNTIVHISNNKTEKLSKLLPNHWMKT